MRSLPLLCMILMRSMYSSTLMGYTHGYFKMTSGRWKWPVGVLTQGKKSNTFPGGSILSVNGTFHKASEHWNIEQLKM